MPEGPELHLASLLVNRISQNRIFRGKVEKSAVSKNPDVDWDVAAYTISATSRGKEVRLTLSAVCMKSKDFEIACNEAYPKVKNTESEGIKPKRRTKDTDKAPHDKTMQITFRFGMSGKFSFDAVEKMHKHAHLNFFTKEGNKVLSFVDARRFGSWEPGGDWSPGRGPCVIFEYDQFRGNILDHLDDSAFNRPICEALLNQKYFNGIGNYLRAEILYRAGIPPFVEARSVLEPLNGCTVKAEKPDLLQLCNILPMEVVKLGPGSGYDPEAKPGTRSAFQDWLQCYNNPNMKSMSDRNKRTIWYSGSPGPLAPKEGRGGNRKKKKKLTEKQTEKLTDQDEKPKNNSSKKPRSAKEPQLMKQENEEASGRITRSSLRKKASSGKAVAKSKTHSNTEAKIKSEGTTTVGSVGSSSRVTTKRIKGEEAEEVGPKVTAKKVKVSPAEDSKVTASRKNSKSKVKKPASRTRRC